MALKQRRNRTGGWSGVLGVALVVASSSPAWACPYAIRAVGFTGWKAPPFHVYLLVKNAMPDREKVTSAFEQASDVVLFDSNVEAQVVNVDKEREHPALRHVQGLKVRTLPAALLVSTSGRAMVLEGIGAKGLSEEALQSELERVVWSEARADIADHIVRHWCVVLVVQGADRADNVRADRAVEAAAKKVVGTMTTMGEEIRLGPHVVRVRAQAPDERIVLWSLGLDQADRKKAHAVVLYGRGRQFGPVLSGETLTQDDLLAAFRGLGENCECITADQWLSQQPVPLRWSEEKQTEVRQVLKVDEEQMRADVLSTWSVSSGRGGGALGAARGYVEVAMPVEGAAPEPGATSEDVAVSPPAAPDASPVPGAEATPTPTAPPVATPAPVSPLEEQAGKVLLLAVGIMVVVMAAAGLLLVARRRQRV